MESNFPKEKREEIEWTTELEQLLEELLIKHLFDFSRTANEFHSKINKQRDIDTGKAKYYEVSSEILRIKWTGVEMKA